MSTDQTKTDHTTAPEKPASATGSTGRLDLSPTKIVGGALAAMTAAALGAQLSVVGTVVGAAVASIVAAVASALYTASLERTGSRVRRIWQRGDVVVVESPVAVEPESPTAESEARATRRRLPWSNIMAGALAAFGLAAVALTGIELITGEALSGGDGTTVSQVRSGDTRPTSPDDSPSSSPASESTESADPTSSPTAESSPTAPTTESQESEPAATPSPAAPTEAEIETEPESAPSPTPSSPGSQTASSAP
jgi:hypothetical protein